VTFVGTAPSLEVGALCCLWLLPDLFNCPGWCNTFPVVILSPSLLSLTLHPTGTVGTDQGPTARLSTPFVLPFSLLQKKKSKRKGKTSNPHSHGGDCTCFLIAEFLQYAQLSFLLTFSFKKIFFW
jgi:hypothetical protein